MEQELIKKAWENYILNKKEIPTHVKGVRDEIIQSWKRSQTYIDASIPFTKKIDEGEFTQLLQDNKLLIDIAYPYLLNFYEDLDSNHFIIMLTDEKGCMLKSIGHKNILNQMTKENHFSDGYYFSEKEAGTGGVGLCLVERKPVIVYGYEHYNESYHHLVCYGAPLENLNGDIIGSISITGDIDYYQSSILGMVKAAKKGIEKEFTLKRMNTILQSSIQSFDCGILVLDSNNQILYHNEKAIALLEYDKKDIHNQKLDTILSKESLEECIQEKNDYECTLINCYNQPLYLSLSIKQNNDTSLSSKIIYLSSQFEKHRLASFIAGFKAIHTFNSIKGISPLIYQLKEIGYNVAKMDTPLLLKGEIGTEVDILSQAIHNESQRVHNPFVKVDCTSSKQNLMNELFGTNEQLGKIELANKGTLFLSEISELPLQVQEKLFLFLKTKTIQKDHNLFPKEIDIRIIAYTHIDLLPLVEKGIFSRQLYLLLNTMQLTIPPLRDRKEDIPILINYICYTNKSHIQFDKESMKALCFYHWPGNIKQLESIIENAIYSHNQPVISLSSLPIDIVNHYYAKDTNKTLLEYQTQRDDYNISKEVQEYNEILFAIKESHGQVQNAAKMLYLPVSTLYRKLKKYNIHPKHYKKL